MAQTRSRRPPYVCGLLLRQFTLSKRTSLGALESMSRAGYLSIVQISVLPFGKLCDCTSTPARLGPVVCMAIRGLFFPASGVSLSRNLQVWEKATMKINSATTKNGYYDDDANKSTLCYPH